MSPDLEPNLAEAIAGKPRYTTVIHCYYAAVFILKTYGILMVLISIDTYKALELARGRLDPGSGTRRKGSKWGCIPLGKWVFANVLTCIHVYSITCIEMY